MQKKTMKNGMADAQAGKALSYWRFYQGYLFPRWIEDMAGHDAIEIYFERYIGQAQHLDHFGCAIELEHRTKPISTRQDLRRVARKITRMGYDFTAAAALCRDVMQERAKAKKELDASRAEDNAKRPRQQADTQPDGVRLLRELRAKHLPQGAVANLSIIRRVVGLPQENTFLRNRKR